MTTRVALAFPLALLAAVTLSGATLAHASLIESDPSEGGAIDAGVPYTLTATFDEELDPAASSIIVRDAAGDEVASGGVSEDELTVMAVDLPALEQGTYTVRWTAVTPDDQGVERGSYSFLVVNTAPTAPPETAPTAPPRPTRTPTATRTPAPSQSAVPSQSPTASSTPAPTATAAPSPTSGGSNDLIIALVLAGVAAAAVIGFVIWRGRA